MKIYSYEGESWTKLPDPFRLPSGGMISPMTDNSFIALGGTIEDDGEPTHWDLLNAACDNFVAVCNDIGTFIGDPNFTGGIDEIDKLYQSEAAQQDLNQALLLAARWEGADKQCNHWASKEDVGLASPAWWWYCWARYANVLEAEEEAEEE